MQAKPLLPDIIPLRDPFLDDPFHRRFDDVPMARARFAVATKEKIALLRQPHQAKQLQPGLAVVALQLAPEILFVFGHENRAIGLFVQRPGMGQRGLRQFEFRVGMADVDPAIGQGIGLDIRELTVG